MQHGFGFVKIIVYLVRKCNKNIVLFRYRMLCIGYGFGLSVVHQHHLNMRVKMRNLRKSM